MCIIIAIELRIHTAKQNSHRIIIHGGVTLQTNNVLTDVSQGSILSWLLVSSLSLKLKYPRWLAGPLERL